MKASERAVQIEAMASLGDPLRRSLYEYVCDQPQPVSRDQAAAAVGVSRPVAAFHLDRLLKEGLLEATFARIGGRNGPGAGRPSKLYRRSSRRFMVSLPPRQYELAARLLLEATASSPSSARLARVARDYGTSLGRDAQKDAGPRPNQRRLRQCAVERLSEQGFEPKSSKDGSFRLTNCPFDRLALAFPSLVCQMNVAIVNGLVDAIAGVGLTAEFDPQPNRCCVVLRPELRRESDALAARAARAPARIIKPTRSQRSAPSRRQPVARSR